MEIKEWRRLAVQCVVLLAAVVIISLCRQSVTGRKEQSETVHAQYQDSGEEMQDRAGEANVDVVDVIYSRQSYIESISDTYIKIPKASNCTASAVYLENHYLDKMVCLSVEGVTKDTFSEQNVERVSQGKSFWGKPSEKDGKDLTDAVTVVQHELGQSGRWKVWINISLKELYEAKLYETETYYYIALQNPRKVYDRIVVLDAGHGGIDEGTLSADEKYLEKEYTLRVVQQLKRLLEETDIKVYYTRLDDRTVSKKKRVWLANQTQADMLVSVHCNASDYGETTAYGMEGLYSGSKEAASQYLTSKKLASIVLKAVTGHTGRRNRGLRKRNDLYLMSHSEVPVTIVEIGYMSNKSDLKYLVREKNQKEIAQGIFQGMEEALEYIRMKEGQEKNE